MRRPPAKYKISRTELHEYNALATATANAKLAGDIQFQQEQMGRSTIDQTGRFDAEAIWPSDRHEFGLGQYHSLQ